MATGYRLDGPGIESWWGARFSTPIQTGPVAQPASCTRGTGSFPGVKSSRGVTLTPHTLLVLWSWKGRAIPLLPLWVIQPVQSLSACTRVTFTFYFFTPINDETCSFVETMLVFAINYLHWMVALICNLIIACTTGCQGSRFRRVVCEVLFAGPERR